MTIKLAATNAQCLSTTTSSASFYDRDRVSSGVYHHHPESPPQQNASVSYSDFDVLIPTSSIVAVAHPRPDMMLLADAIKMNDINQINDSNNNNNENKSSNCDNRAVKMGINCHNNNQLKDRDASNRSLSSSPHIQDDDDSRESANGSRLAQKRRLLSTGAADEIDKTERLIPVDDDDINNDEDDDEVDCGGDNDSVLSVGRDENNFVEEEDEDEEDDHEERDHQQKGNSSYSFISKATSPAEQEHQTATAAAAPPAAPPSADKLNLGLSFRNIHNHLTSLKNYSPSNTALWKSSAFQAATMPTFSGYFPVQHPTVELLHRYDMLRRGSNLNHRQPTLLQPPSSSSLAAAMGNGGGGGVGMMLMTQKELHEESLKFSIDNILKADFGRRRITDPINKLRKISNSIIQTTAISNLSNVKQQQQQLPLPSPGHSSSFSTFDPMSPISTTSNSSSSPVLRSPPPPLPMAAASQGTAAAAFGESATKLFSPMDLTASNGSSGGVKRGEEKGVGGSSSSSKKEGAPMVWPAWVYCTRYSDRPSSGRSPRTRKPKKQDKRPTANGSAAMGLLLSPNGTSPPSSSTAGAASTASANSSDSSCSNNTTSTAAANDDKRPRTAFSGPQLARLKHEFNENRYLTEKRRQQLSAELGLHEAQIKIWFQNKRAKIKKTSGQKNPLALQLMAQGLYNHSTIPLTKEEEKLQDLHAQQAAAAAAASASTV